MPFNMHGLKKAPHVLLAASNNLSCNEGTSHASSSVTAVRRTEENVPKRTSNSVYANSVDIDLWDCKPTTNAGMQALSSNSQPKMAGQSELNNEGDMLVHSDDDASATVLMQPPKSKKPTPPPPPPLPLSLDLGAASCPDKSLAAVPVSGSSAAACPVIFQPTVPAASYEAMTHPSPAAVPMGTADDLKNSLQAEIAKRKVRPPPTHAAQAEVSPPSKAPRNTTRSNNPCPGYHSCPRWRSRRPEECAAGRDRKAQSQATSCSCSTSFCSWGP